MLGDFLFWLFIHTKVGDKPKLGFQKEKQLTFVMMDTRHHNEC
jgi:hypothetical protein